MERSAIVSVRSVPPGGYQTHTPGRQVAVFLDRDGVFNSTDGFVNSPDDLDARLLPGAVAAIAKLTRETDARVVLVTNQGGVDQGHMTRERCESILERLALRVEEAGGRLDALYYCPSAKRARVPEGEVDCRKPEPGMFYAAARDFGPAIDLADSYMIGDMTTDIAAGEAADRDVTTIMLRTGFAGEDGKCDVPADHWADDLTAAVDWIVAREAGR